MTCGCNDKCELPKALQINNPGEVTLFHRVEVPASQGDDETYPPKNGLYRNVLLVYLANNHAYLYSSDGIPTRVDGDSAAGVPKGGLTGQVLVKKTDEDYDTKWETQTSVNDAKLTLTRNNTEIGDFTANASVDKTIDIEVPTKTSDLENDGATGESTYAEATDINAIWEEIEEIEAASDVTDVVGTHAELEAYDTSKLKDNDIIKVLEDETQNDQITYYRWDTDTETFTLIGAIGPYYTKSEANTTFQGKLTAGSNITIDANNEISATDTTYTAGEGVEINNNTIAAKVRRVYDYYTSRPTSADLTATGNGGMFTFQATTAMATGKPKNDAPIIHLEWDNANGYDVQLAVSNNANSKWVGFRQQSAGTWGNWIYLLNDEAGSVKTANIDALAVTTAKIADGAITEAKINVTDWAKKVNVASIDITGQTTTLLSLTKALGTNNIDYARWECRTDIGSADISDKPTNYNASFVCEAYCNRWTASNDYRYQLICWIKESTNPFVAYIANHSSSIAWERLRPTVNDATLTIQKNGTTVETFTANSSANKTANITVPTKTSDLTNDGADSTSTYIEADELQPSYITDEGTSITLANTQGSRFSNVNLKGDTEQVTYSGKNLFNVFATPVGGNLSEANVTATVNSDGTMSTSGISTATYKNIRFDMTLPAGTYKFSGCPSGGTQNGYSMLLVASGNSYWDYGSGETFTLSATTTINVYPVRLGSSTGLNMNGKIFKPMVTVSTASQTFEPYVGTVPSPNPSYPQAVQTVTGEQTISVNNNNLIEITPSNHIVRGTYVSGANTDQLKITATGSDLYLNEVKAAGSTWDPANQGNIIPAELGETFYFNSGNASFTKNLVTEYDENKISLGYYSLNAASGSFTTRLNGCKYISLRIGYEPAAVGTTYTLAPIVAKTSISGYEPYQNQTYTINFGKNLLDTTVTQPGFINASGNYQANTGSQASVYIEVLPNTAYTASATATYRYIGFAEYTSEKAFIGSIQQGGDTNSYSITTTAATKFIRVFYNKSTSITAQTLRDDKAQIEIGPARTDYVLYADKVELCKIGSYQDYIYKNNGTWYLHKETGKIVDNGASGWGASGATVASGVSAYVHTGLNIPDYTTGYVNMATLKTSWSDWTTGDGLQSGAAAFLSNNYYFKISTSIASTVAQLQTFLANNPLITYYPLVTATDTQITGTLLDDLNAFDQATGYQGNTYITVSSASPDLPAILNVTAEEKSILPTATETSLGAVSVGDGLEVTEGGVLSLADNVVYSEDPGTPIGDVVDPYTYSTTETRIGTWIDGKPLYRRVFTGTASTMPFSVATLTNCNVKNIYGRITYNGSSYHQIGGYANANYYSLAQQNYSNYNIDLYGSSNYVGQQYELVAEYTKTTD